VFCGQLQTATENIFYFYFPSIVVFSALEVCYENVLYKFTFDVDIGTGDTQQCIGLMGYQANGLTD